MKKQQVWLLLIFVFCIAIPVQSKYPKGIPHLKWMKEVGARQIPPLGDVFLVNDYGAVADTSVLSTLAVQKAIDACFLKGGGTVTFSKGSYCIGSIFLKSGVNLNIPEGVQLFGSQDLNDYPIIDTRVAGIEMKWPAALITAIGQKKVMISGKGKIWGQGKVFWDKYWTMRRAYDKKGLRWIIDYDCMRPRLVLIQDCQDVTMKEASFFEAGFWTVHLLYSQYVTIDGILVNNNNASKGPSTDGIDIDSSNRILVQNCDISCNDDNFCLKAGRDADGLRVNRPTEYVVIRNCIARQGDGLFTCGSETSGGIRNIVSYNMTALGTKVGLRFKSAMNRGGVVENIYLSNIKMQEIRDPFQINLNWNPAYSYSELPKGISSDSIPVHWKVMLTKVEPFELGIPKFRNIWFTDIQAKNCKVAILCEGVESSPVEGFHLTNVHITGENPGKLYWAKDWKLKNVSITGEFGEHVDIKNSVNVPLNN
jgi:hypothetical protein